MRHPRVAAGEELLRLNGSVFDAGQVRRRVGHVDGAQERLARHARVVRALAAEQFALDERGAQATLDGVLGDILTHRPAADDDDVGVEFVSVSHPGQSFAVVAGAP